MYGNPIDNTEVNNFTLESELQRLSNQLQKDGEKSLAEMTGDAVDIRRLVSQAEPDRDKLSERGVVAVDYLQLKKESWDKLNF